MTGARLPAALPGSGALCKRCTWRMHAKQQAGGKSSGVWSASWPARASASEPAVPQVAGREPCSLA